MTHEWIHKINQSLKPLNGGWGRRKMENEKWEYRNIYLKSFKIKPPIKVETSLGREIKAFERGD